jgi:hypothetical protein
MKVIKSLYEITVKRCLQLVVRRHLLARPSMSPVLLSRYM